jgi:hypothetical protein
MYKEVPGFEKDQSIEVYKCSACNRLNYNNNYGSLSWTDLSYRILQDGACSARNDFCNVNFIAFIP